MGARRWSEADSDFIRKHYKQMPTRELAAKVGRQVGAVHQHARRMGLHRERDNEAIGNRVERIKELHAEGLSSRDIADAVGMNSRHVRWWMARLGLPAHGHTARVRQKLKRATARQCERAGVPNLAELRVQRMKQLNRRLGWPESLSLRAVQLIELLYQRGPMTRKQLAAASGIRWRGKATFSNSRVPGHNYTAELVRSGLVVRLESAITRAGRGNHEDLYMLGLGVEPCHENRNPTSSASAKSKRA